MITFIVGLMVFPVLFLSPIGQEFRMLYAVCFALFLLGLALHLHEQSTPAALQIRRENQLLNQENRHARLRRRHALRDLDARRRRVARSYFRDSVWHGLRFTWDASRCRTDAALNRYVTLAEHYWSTRP